MRDIPDSTYFILNDLRKLAYIDIRILISQINEKLQSFHRIFFSYLHPKNILQNQIYLIITFIKERMTILPALNDCQQYKCVLDVTF